MRLRKKKHRDARLEACAGLYFDSGFRKPVFLEIGCGKGGFICGLACDNPDINFAAVERNPDVILIAMEKARGMGLKNLRFINDEAENLADYFGPEQVAGIYLNFSDPWHKNYQVRKRLTYKTFLDIYKNILVPGSKIIMKTDNRKLFDFSVKSLYDNGFLIFSLTHDLYSDGVPDDNIQTEYEKKFVGQGIKICRLEAGYLISGTNVIPSESFMNDT